MTEYEIIGTFRVIFEDEDEENAIMQAIENYLASLKDDCDEYFKSVEFEFDDVEAVE